MMNDFEELEGRVSGLDTRLRDVLDAATDDLERHQHCIVTSSDQIEDLNVRVRLLEHDVERLVTSNTDLVSRVKNLEGRPTVTSALFAIWLSFCVSVGIGRLMVWLGWY
jgi:hypothetical protein